MLNLKAEVVHLQLQLVIVSLQLSHLVRLNIGLSIKFPLQFTMTNWHQKRKVLLNSCDRKFRRKQIRQQAQVDYIYWKTWKRQGIF